MRLISITFICFCTLGNFYGLNAFAQSTETAPSAELSSATDEAVGSGRTFSIPPSSSYVGLSFVQWNEKIKLQSGNLSDEDNANFKGLNVHFEKRIPFIDWGWAFAGTLGSGLASGGGKSALVAYQKGNQAWTSFGVYAKAYKKITEQIELGLVIPAVYRQIKWETLNAALPSDSGKAINIGLQFEMNFQISRKFSFYQDIGPFSTEGATFWRLGLAYQL